MSETLGHDILPWGSVICFLSLFSAGKILKIYLNIFFSHFKIFFKLIYLSLVAQVFVALHGLSSWVRGGYSFCGAWGFHCRASLVAEQGPSACELQ